MRCGQVEFPITSGRMRYGYHARIRKLLADNEAYVIRAGAADRGGEKFRVPSEFLRAAAVASAAGLGGRRFPEFLGGALSTRCRRGRARGSAVRPGPFPEDEGVERSESVLGTGAVPPIAR
jgi:hypothetical protein